MLNGSLFRAGNVFSSVENPFLKRFESVSADCVYGISAAEKVNGIRQLFAEADIGESPDIAARGAAGYAYMEFFLAREASASLSNAANFAELIKEKYRCMTAVGGGNSAAKWALEDAQLRIDELMGTGKNEKIDPVIYNKCAESFATAFGTELSRLAVTEDEFNGLFGKMDATEANYSFKCSDRARTLWQRYDELKDCRDSILEKLEKKKGAAAEKAFEEVCGNSYADIESLLTEVGIL